MNDVWVRGIFGNIEHRNGIAWFDAPIPRRWHRCWAQTRGLSDGVHVYRCPCGAIRWGAISRWSERNSRSRL